MNMLASHAQIRASFLRWSLFLVPLCVLLGFLSGQMGAGADSAWFQALEKPSIFPAPMWFGIVWSILYVMIGLSVALVALVIIGPKDLPKAMRVVGYWVGRARSVTRQFRSGFDAMVREAELAEMEKKWAEEATGDFAQCMQTWVAMMIFFIVIGWQIQKMMFTINLKYGSWRGRL